MHDETKSRNTKVLIIGLLLLAVAAGAVAVFYLFGPINYRTPLEYVATTEEKQTKLQGTVEDLYTQTARGGILSAEGAKKISDITKEYTSSTKTLLEAPALTRDDKLKAKADAFSKVSERYVGRINDLVQSMRSVEALRKACTTKVFEDLRAAKDKASGWIAFQPCYNESQKLDTNTIPTQEYKQTFNSLKKAYQQTKEYLADNKGDIATVEESLNSLSALSNEADTTVRARTLGSLPNNELQAIRSYLQEKIK